MAGKKSKNNPRNDRDKARTKLRKWKRVLRSNGIAAGKTYLEKHPEMKTFYSAEVKELHKRYPLDLN